LIKVETYLESSTQVMIREAETQQNPSPWIHPNINDSLMIPPEEK